MTGNSLGDAANFVVAAPERVQPELKVAGSLMSATSEYRA
jgi:hypothetical protein